MRKIICIILLLLTSKFSYATEQIPDKLLYNGKLFSLATGWGHPSPLQTYFYQKDLKSPFPIRSTANYRGHIATWEINNNKFILKEIRVGDEIDKAEKYDIKASSDSIIENGSILADWFTGVLSCYIEKNPKETLFFYIRDGEVIDNRVITEKDYKKIEKISEKDTTNHELMKKYAILILNQNYISYYFRLSTGGDQISISNGVGRFMNKQGFSPILGLFGNNHSHWPYNWENFEKTGAPLCKWIVEENKIYLKEIELNTGTSFVEVATENIPLDELFTTEIVNNRVYANWISGIYTIQHGEEKEDALFPGMKEFKIENISYLRIESGLILEEYTVPANYLAKGIPEDADLGLKKILEELEL